MRLLLWSESQDPCNVHLKQSHLSAVALVSCLATTCLFAHTRYMQIPVSRAYTWLLLLHRYVLLILQGLGRHSLHDFNILLRDDLQTLSTLLDAKPYLLGPTPCEADASLFGIIDVILNDGVISCELRRIVEGFPNLCRWVGC